MLRSSLGRRTATANLRSPSHRLVAALPASAASMTSCTSPTFRPWRAARSRLTSMSSCGTWPSRSISARATPGTWRTSRAMASVRRLSSARSSPASLMTICPLICEMDSSTLSRMGCENAGSIPGMALSARCISAVIFSRVMPGRHWSSGLMSTNTSTEAMVLGSVPSSGWPAFDTVVRTSGTVSSAWRAMRRMRVASSLDTEGAIPKLTQVVPSFSSGRNSEPRREATSPVAPKASSASTSTLRWCASAQSSTGAYRLLAPRTTRLSPCGRRRLSIQ